MSMILAYVHKMDKAEFIVHYAVSLAQELKEDVEVLYSIELQNYPMGIPGTSKPNYEKKHEYTEHVLDKINSELESIINRTSRSIKDSTEISYTAKEGISHDIIKNHTIKKEVSYVIVSSNTENERLINDRNMDIIKNVTCPVLVITERMRFNPYQEIIYATDYEDKDIENLNRLALLAETGSARITALHINTDSDTAKNGNYNEFKKRIKKEAGYKDIDLVVLSKGEDKSLSETIFGFAKQRKADMIAAMTREKGLFERIFRESKAEQIMKVSDIPVLIFQENEQS